MAAAVRVAVARVPSVPRVATVSGPQCFYCRKSIPRTTPRVTIDGRWACEDCAYLIEYNKNPKRVEPPLRLNKLRPQAEELFDA